MHRRPALHTHVVFRDVGDTARDVVVIRICRGTVTAQITARLLKDETGAISARDDFHKPRPTVARTCELLSTVASMVRVRRAHA
jgi:hypothetical protein